MLLKRLFAIDLRALALFRISLALLLLAQLADRASVLKAFYTDAGIFPRMLAMSLTKPGDWSIYFLTGNIFMTTLFFLIAAFFAFLLLLGYKTRLAIFVSYFFIVSLQTRNIIIPNGGDYLLRLLTFWSLFLPLGARFSLDNRRSANATALSERVVSIGTIAFLLQVFFVYFFTALSKLGSDVWINGEAVYDALTIEHYGRPFAHVISHMLPIHFYPFLSYAVVATEFVGALLLFFPFGTSIIRLVVIFVFALLQLGFGLCLEVNLFPWAAVAATLPFLPTKFCDSLWYWGSRIAKIKFQKINSKPRPIITKAFSIGSVLAGFFLIYVTCINLEGLTYKSPFYRSILPQSIIPKEFRWIGGLLKLDQSWDMFLPPGKITYWFVAPGKLKDGSSVDILRDGAPVNWEKPKTFFKNEPWRAYLMNLGGHYKNALAPYVGPYFCREWNKNKTGNKRLESFEVFVMSQENVRPPQQSKQYFNSLLKYSC